MVQEPGWEFGRDTGVSTPALAMSATGSLVTTGSQDLGFNVSSERRCSRQDGVRIYVPGRWGSYIGQRDEHPLLALQHLYKQQVWSSGVLTSAEAIILEGVFLLLGLGRWIKMVGTASGLKFCVPLFVSMNWLSSKCNYQEVMMSYFTFSVAL